MDCSLTMVRGDSMSFNLVLDGVETLDSAFFSVKKSLEATEYILQKSIGDGITKQEGVGDQGDGLYCVRIAPEDTENIEAGNYYYDCQISVDGDVFTVLRGILKIEQDVTTKSN